MINLGLSRITSLLTHHPVLSHRQLPFQSFHIAGTNGKGSVASYLSALLYAYNFRPVGRFTSPHLIDRWDCISIDEETVSESLFRQCEDEVQWVDQENRIGASEFELLTATAFSCFAKKGVKWAVVECGVGGARDATNVLRADEVCCSVMTRIGRDHEALLGVEGEAGIAREKSGIFKSGVPAVVDGKNLVNEGVRRVLEEQAKNVGVLDNKVIWAKWEYILEKRSQLDGSLQALIDHAQQQRNLTPYQLDNLAVALTAFRTARQSPGTRDTTTSPRSERPAALQDLLPFMPGFGSKPSWPGRLQTIHLPPSLTNQPNQSSFTTLLDGAHNPQAAQLLSEYVQLNIRNPSPSSPTDPTPHSQQRPITWLLATTQGKDTHAILSTLISPGDQVVTCEFGPVDGMPWIQAEICEKLCEVAREILATSVSPSGGPSPACTAIKDPRLALQEAVRLTSSVDNGGSENLVIAGSLYLAGDILRLLRDAVK